MVVICLACLLFTGCAVGMNGRAISPSGHLSKQLDAIAHKNGFYSEDLGLSVRSVKTGEVLYELNARKKFIPASNVKLITTAAAMEILKPEFRYRTVLSANGIVEASTLKGSLVIKGSGDPTLGSRYFAAGATVFHDWADALLKLGIRKIDGAVLVDNSCFQGLSLERDWSTEEDVFCYSPEINAFSYGDNCASVLIVPGVELDAQALTHVMPMTEEVIIVNKVSTDRKGGLPRIRLKRLGYPNVLEISGTLPLGGEALELPVAVRSAHFFGASLFLDVLRASGITVTGGMNILRAGSQTDGADEKLIGIYHSPPLWQIIPVINGLSRNLPAELLFEALERESFTTKEYGTISTSSIGGFMKKVGFYEEEYSIVDGSGLSRSNQLSPSQIVRVLKYVADTPYFDLFYRSLSTAGVDGTLRKAMIETPCAGNLKGKSGTLQNVRNLSGYVTTADGELLAISFMLNGVVEKKEAADKLYSEFCSEIALFSRRRDGER